MGVNITSRQLNIIKTLLSSSEAVSSIALSQEIGCSTKTVQGEIKDLNKLLKNSKVISIRGLGYKIEGNLEELDLNTNPNIYSDIDRVQHIIKKLLNLSSKKDNAIKLEDLADSMYVSVSTVKNDLKEVKNILNKYNIVVSTKYKKGIFAQGEEKNILNCIIDLCNKKENELNLNDFLTTSVQENSFAFKKELLNILNEENLILTDTEFKNILNYILLSLSRSKDNKYIKKYILDYKIKRDLIINNNDNKESIINSIKKFVKNLKVVTSIDISTDLLFEECLYNHINNLYKRIQLGINQYSIDVNDVKIKYPFAFELAKIAKKTIEKDLDININEDEVANIALHVGGALERVSQNDDKKVLKTIIVCSSGVGTSMLIKSKLENIFKEKLEIIKIIPSYLVDYISAIDVDFVISTVPLSIEDIDVIIVSPMLREKEVKIIEKYIETEKIYLDVQIKNLLEQDLFFVDVDMNSKEEVITYMANKLVEKNYIDDEMKLSYIEREKMATTEIGNMVAIPHGANGVINESKIAICILKNPIYWEFEKVRLVIMLAIDKDKILDYEELFLNIYKRIDSIAKVINICENKNFEKFYNMFN